MSLTVVKVLPKNFLKFLYKFGIFINPELDDDYKKFLYARLEHILLNYDDAIVNYSKHQFYCASSKILLLISGALVDRLDRCDHMVVLLIRK